MDRRQLAKHIGLTAALFGACGIAAPTAGKQPQVAITIGDFIVDDTPTLTGAKRNRAMLDALHRHRLRAAVFVTGRYVQDDAKMRLLRL